MAPKIKDLKADMQNLTLIAKVVQKSKVDMRGHPPKRYASAIIEDETGRIKLNLWRDQVDQVEEGDVIKIPKAFVHIRGKSVQVSTWSTIEPINP